MSEFRPLHAEPDQIQRLQDAPNWIYLLREFETLYRHGSAGGSKARRSSGTHRS